MYESKTLANLPAYRIVPIDEYKSVLKKPHLFIH